MSKRFQLNSADVKKWVTNAAIFFAPALLIFLTAIQAGTPYEQAIYLVYLWLLGSLIDLLRKFVNGK